MLSGGLCRPASVTRLHVSRLTFQERKEQQQKNEGVGGLGAETVKQRRFRIFYIYMAVSFFVVYF